MTDYPNEDNLIWDALLAPFLLSTLAILALLIFDRESLLEMTGGWPWLSIGLVWHVVSIGLGVHAILTGSVQYALAGLWLLAAMYFLVILVAVIGIGQLFEQSYLYDTEQASRMMIREMLGAGYIVYKTIGAIRQLDTESA